MVDSEKVFFEATCDMSDSVGIGLSAKQWTRCYGADGNSAAEISANLGIPKCEAETPPEWRDELFCERIEAGVALPPYVMETLEWPTLHAGRTAVTSASRGHFEHVNRHSSSPTFFDAIVTSVAYSVPKPDPGIYWLSVERLGLSSVQCRALENTPRGAWAARAAGLPCGIIPTMLTDTNLCPPEGQVMSHVGELVTWFLKGQML